MLLSLAMPCCAAQLDIQLAEGMQRACYFCNFLASLREIIVVVQSCIPMQPSVIPLNLSHTRCTFTTQFIFCLEGLPHRQILLS
jgi:hypothetical protein